MSKVENTEKEHVHMNTWTAYNLQFIGVNMKDAYDHIIYIYFISNITNIHSSIP